MILVAFDKDPSAGGAANSWPRVPWHVLQFLGDEEGFKSARRRLNDADGAPRLLHLLETMGLATPPDHPGWIGISPLRVGVERKTLERLDRLARS